MNKDKKDLIKYHFKALNSFLSFLKDGDNEALLNSLQEIQSHYEAYHRSKKDAGIWFRFFKDDSLCTTLQDFYNTLRRGTKENKAYLKECMEISCNTGEIKVYYS